MAWLGTYLQFPIESTYVSIYQREFLKEKSASYAFEFKGFKPKNLKYKITSFLLKENFDDGGVVGVDTTYFRFRALFPPSHSSLSICVSSTR